MKYKIKKVRVTEPLYLPSGTKNHVVNKVVFILDGNEVFIEDYCIEHGDNFDILSVDFKITKDDEVMIC